MISAFIYYSAFCFPGRDDELHLLPVVFFHPSSAFRVTGTTTKISTTRKSEDDYRVTSMIIGMTLVENCTQCA